MRRIVALVIALAALAGCVANYQGGTANVAGHSVYLFGDSNLGLAGSTIVGQFGPQFDAYVDGWGGSTTQNAWVNQTTNTPWTTIIPTDLNTKLPSTLSSVVVQLGTNDCTRPLGAPTMTDAQINAIMNQIPANIPVHWNNVFVHPGNFCELSINAVVLPQAIINPLHPHPNLHIEDYNGHFQGHPEWVNQTAGGDVHLTPAGINEYTTWVKGFVQ